MTHSVVKMCSSVQFLTAVHRHTYTHSICERECERSVTFSMFALWNATFACGIHSTRERSFEEASGEMEVGRGQLVPEPRPLPPLAPWTCPRHANRTPTWSSDLCGRYFAWNRTITPVVMLAKLWQQLQRCRQTRARVQVFFTHFTSVLRQQFAANDTFLREVNGYKKRTA